MKSFKYVLTKYTILIVLIVGAWMFLFAKTLPKSASVAKKEIIEDVLDLNFKKSTNKIKTNDSVPRIKGISKEVVIPIETDSTSTYLAANVNGVKVKFLLDTGCSDVQITSAEYYYMKHLGLVDEDDIKDEKVTCTYANNSQEECHVINLKSFNIGGVELKNITASIQENCDAPCLLGQNVLSQLGVVTIDYKGKKILIK